MTNNQHQNQQRATFNMASGENSFTIQIDRGVMIGGIARQPGGDPAAGVRISIRGIGPDNNHFGNGTQTGADGRYQLEAPADSVCMLIVEDQNWAAELKTDITVEKKKDISDLNFDLRTPTKITGRIAVRASGRPAVNQSVSLEQSGMDTNSNPQLRRSQGGNQYVPPLNHYRQTTTDADGRFEFKVGPGRFLLRGSRNAAQQQFTVKDEPALNFDFTVERPDRGPFTAQIDAGKTGADVAGTTIEIRSENQWWTPEVAEADSAGKVTMERSLLRAFVHARSKDGKFGQIVAIDPDTETTTIDLQTCGDLTGRLVHATSGKALANADFVYGIRPDLGITIYGGVSFAGASGKTDGDGRFTISNLVINQNYDIDLVALISDEAPVLQQNDRRRRPAAGPRQQPIPLHSPARSAAVISWARTDPGQLCRGPTGGHWILWAATQRPRPRAGRNQTQPLQWFVDPSADVS
jgi:5-hydroxyisourate hydrolase-like protein (transthyretin family)